MSGLLGQSLAPAAPQPKAFQPTQQGPQFSNPLFNSAPVNPYVPTQGFTNPLFMSAPLQNAPVPYVQQPSSVAPFKPPLTMLQQIESLRAGNGGK